jgi:hypothetical protein
MHLHPLLLSSLLLDLLSVLLLLAAGLKAYKIVLGWQPGSPDAKQLRLERASEVATLQSSWALALCGFSTLLLILSISNILPSIIPGAMCGTGVMAAAEPYGHQAMWLRGIALAFLFWQQVVGRLNRQSTEALLTPLHARLTLATLPLLVLSFVYTARFTLALDIQQTVDCCTVVYDAVRKATTVDPSSQIGSKILLLGSWAIGGGLLVGMGIAAGLTRPKHRLHLTFVLAAMSIVWVPLAFLSLKYHISAYYYQVLAHHCPWCLLLPEHRFAGFLLYGLLYFVLLEGPAAALSARISAKYKPLSATADRHSRKAGWSVAACVTGFILFTAIPALWWKWQYGVWME